MATLICVRLLGRPFVNGRHVLPPSVDSAQNAVAATKWHLVSKAHGETDLMLDDFVNGLDAKTREAGEKAAKPYLDALKKPPS